MTERNKAVPAAYLLLDKGDELLLMKRIGSYYGGWYSVPAGHVEEGELPTEALARESREEIGISIDPEDARLVHTMYRAKHDETGDRIDLFYKVNKWAGEISNIEPEKCSEIMWFPKDKLPANLMHHVGRAIIDVENGVDSSELSLAEVHLNPSGKT